VGPRAGLDTEARGKIISPLPGIEPRLPGRPARSQDTILPELTRLQLVRRSVRKHFFATKINNTAVYEFYFCFYNSHFYRS
jgi:hypothetical protein